jgi:hypothetical protein
MFRKNGKANASKGEPTRRALTSADLVGKVFVVLGHGMRRCLICEQVFTAQGAEERVEMVCHVR